MNDKSDTSLPGLRKSEFSVPGYKILEKIGCGTYATVFKAYRLKEKKELVAVKVVDRTRLAKQDIENLLTEIKMLKLLQHQNIVVMKEFQWDPKNVYIVMEYCDGGDLSLFIQKRQKLPEDVCHMFLQQLAMGLCYLRSYNVCHLDLKPSNLLIVTKPKLLLKIGDFGFAQFLSNETYQGALRGSPLYMAPEMLLRRQFDAKVDLWSVGIIFYECLFGKAPFASSNFKELREKLISEVPIEIPEHGLSRYTRDMLKRLLQYNPEERIDFELFFAHPLIDVVHQPSPRTYSYAVDLLHQAVKHDSNKEFKDAFGLYCDALAFLVPHVHAEKDPDRKEALKTRLAQYSERAEVLLTVLKVQQPQNAQTVANLSTLCASTPALANAIEIAQSAQMYLADGFYQAALEKFEVSLETLIELLYKEPPGTRKDLLFKQVKEWMDQAARTKALAEMGEINRPVTELVERKTRLSLHLQDLCSLQ